jgi:hypothetical protein
MKNHTNERHFKCLVSSPNYVGAEGLQLVCCRCALPSSLAVTCWRDIGRTVRIPIDLTASDPVFRARSQKLNVIAATPAPGVNPEAENVYLPLLRARKPRQMRTLTLFLV